MYEMNVEMNIPAKDFYLGRFMDRLNVAFFSVK